MSNPVKSSAADLTPDPLLKSGLFIDDNGQNRSSKPTNPPNGSSPYGAQPEARSSPLAVAKGKRRVVPPETWLPAGWLVEDRVRTSGATAGTVDKYYVDPSSGRKFRSKKEVLYFIETGITPTKRKKGMETSGTEEVSTGISADTKQRKSEKKTKPLNFDFTNVPEKVDWLLTNASVDSWTPFLGDEQVPESTRQDWAAAFTFLTTSNRSKPMF
ncbi:Methyl-CpG DNA binding - like 9 [Theobroma cacao]|nr:Methyl-CpG DNA binding - like 9 [Theobroma cacao]